jgi:hypothetical protein
VTGTFTAPLLDALRTARTVRIETRPGLGAKVRATVIWIVVDDADRVLVRSVRGSRGRWYRDLRAHSRGALVLDGSRIGIRAEVANDPARVASCSRALAEKYSRSGASLTSMIVPEVLDATLELHPA